MTKSIDEEKYTENLKCMEDAIGTSVFLKFFTSYDTAFRGFLTKTKLTTLNIKPTKLELNNFYSGFLQTQSLDEMLVLLCSESKGKTLPEHKKSILYHMNKIKNKQKLSPIYVVKKSNALTLLDGVHRILGSYYSGKFTVPMYLIEL
jgi:hypothetical protein